MEKIDCRNVESKKPESARVLDPLRTEASGIDWIAGEQRGTRVHIAGELHRPPDRVPVRVGHAVCLPVQAPTRLPSASTRA
jgi:hypothetical protein